MQSQMNVTSSTNAQVPAASSAAINNANSIAALAGRAPSTHIDEFSSKIKFIQQQDNPNAIEEENDKDNKNSKVPNEESFDKSKKPGIMQKRVPKDDFLQSRMANKIVDEKEIDLKVNFIKIFFN